MIVIFLDAKCDDCCSVNVYEDPDAEAECSEVTRLRSYSGYVPESSLGKDDRIMLRIDNATGRILDWVPIDLEKLNEED